MSGVVQAIYPVLIIVIVALNWSPIEHGLSDGTQLAGEDACPPARLDLNRATMSTVAIADSIQMRYVQNKEDSPLEATTKQDTVVV